MSPAEKRASALAAGDAERLSAVLHDDFRWTSHVGVTLRPSEVHPSKHSGRHGWRSQQLRNVGLVVVGDTAVLYVQVTHAVLSEDDETETFRMPMTQVWVRLDRS